MDADIRMLGRAACISIFCHLAVLLSFRYEMPLGEPTSDIEKKAIDVHFRSFNTGTPTPPIPFTRHSPIHSPASLAATTRPASKIVSGTETSVFPPVSRSTAADEGLNGHKSITVSGESMSGAGAVPNSIEVLGFEGVPQYRLNLAREARQNKRYPIVARQRGWEGIVVVLVTMAAKGAAPYVSLGQSSGFELLDQEALELVSKAVQTAEVPGSLRNRQFSLSLPIHYRLEN